MKNDIEIPKGTQLIDLADIKEEDWVFKECTSIWG